MYDLEIAYTVGAELYTQIIENIATSTVTDDNILVLFEDEGDTPKVHKFNLDHVVYWQEPKRDRRDRDEY